MHAKKNWRNRYHRYANQLQFLMCKLRQKLVRNPRSGYTLVDDRLYTLNPIRLKNSRIHLQYQAFVPSNDQEVHELNESFYLLLLHEDNLAHFFHDIFFPVYVRWRQNPHKVFASINENRFLKDFLIAVFGVNNVVFAKRSDIYHFQNLLLTPESRNIRSFDGYKQICKEIKAICFKHYGIQENRTRHLLYGRTELTRKKLLNIDVNFLNTHLIEQPILSKLSFEETIRTLAQAKTFAYIVGAGVFYLLFLDENVRVLEINPYQNNSWAQMFGLADLCQLQVHVSKNIHPSSNPAQGDPQLDSHVYFDEAIKEKLLMLAS
ncbi:hypothetical protein PHIN6_02780 [Polynucleobacter sp. HIN6]|nr:hypothetical protein PHIN6_02780 [Polynucleobacter sp. HIN6]